MEYEVKDLSISNVNVYDSNKAGVPFKTKPQLPDYPDGKPFKKVNFKVDVGETGVDDPSFEGWLSVLDFDGFSDNWDDGMKITGTIVKNGDFWNFQLPKRTKKALEDEVEALKKKLSALESTTEPQEVQSVSIDDVIEDDDLPF